MGDKPQGLIDTGAILAFLDRDDRWHERCVDAHSRLKLPLATSAAVLAELFHLLRRSTAPSAAWGFLTSGAVTVLPITDVDLPQLEALMVRYRDSRPFRQLPPEERRDRLRRLQGIGRGLLSSSEEFARRKAEEIEIEERKLAR